MKRWIFRIAGGLLLAGSILLANQWLTAEPIEPPDVWQSMAVGEVQIQRPDGSSATLPVRIAQTASQRAQGMQHLPAAIIREHPIWFAFNQPQVVSWHMRNVALPLDILYIDVSGRIIGREVMQPNGTGYGINAPITAALELAAGQAADYGLEVGVRLRLGQ